MAYQKPVLDVVGPAASIVLGDRPGVPFDNLGPEITSPGSLLLGLDE